MSPSDPSFGPPSSGYDVHYVKGRPILATPAAPAWLGRLGIRYSPGEQPKWRLLRMAMRLAHGLRLGSLLTWRMEQPPLPHPTFDFSQWMTRMGGILKIDDPAAVVVWPTARGRFRVYAHLLNRTTGRCVAFGKLAFNELVNERFERESKLMGRIDRWNLQGVHVPKIIGEDVMDGCRYLLYEPLPERIRPTGRTWAQARDEFVAGYAGPARYISHDQLTELDWWQQFIANVPANRPFRRELESCLPSRIEVCRAHGDLGPTHNMLITADERWLVDWEQAGDTAPVLADEVGFYLFERIRVNLKHPSRALAHLRQRFGLEDPDRRVRTMLALVFLGSVGHSSARRMIDAWPSTPSGAV